MFLVALCTSASLNGHTRPILLLPAEVNGMQFNGASKKKGGSNLLTSHQASVLLFLQAIEKIPNCLFFLGRQGRFGLIEMDESHPDNNVAAGRVILRNVATQVGIDFSTGK